MINKHITSPAQAVADIYDGATVMIGGFGEAGSPIELIHALSTMELAILRSLTTTPAAAISGWRHLSRTVKSVK